MSGYLDNLDFDDIERISANGIKDTGVYSLPRLVEHDQLSPVWSFDFVSLSATDFCFDNCKVTTIDYHKLFAAFNRVSKVKYSELSGTARQNTYRFHEVSISKLRACGLQQEFTKSRAVSRLPTMYQFEVHTDHSRHVAPRVIGYIGRFGIFYVVWLDLEHKIYPEA